MAAKCQCAEVTFRLFRMLRTWRGMGECPKRPKCPVRPRCPRVPGGTVSAPSNSQLAPRKRLVARHAALRASLCAIPQSIEQGGDPRAGRSSPPPLEYLPRQKTDVGGDDDT